MQCLLPRIITVAAMMAGQARHEMHAVMANGNAKKDRKAEDMRTLKSSQVFMVEGCPELKESTVDTWEKRVAEKAEEIALEIKATGNLQSVREKFNVTQLSVPANTLKTTDASTLRTQTDTLFNYLVNIGTKITTPPSCPEHMIEREKKAERKLKEEAAEKKKMGKRDQGDALIDINLSGHAKKAKKDQDKGASKAKAASKAMNQSVVTAEKDHESDVLSTDSDDDENDDDVVVVDDDDDDDDDEDDEDVQLDEAGVRGPDGITEGRRGGGDAQAQVHAVKGKVKGKGNGKNAMTTDPGFTSMHSSSSSLLGPVAPAGGFPLMGLGGGGLDMQGIIFECYNVI